MATPFQDFINTELPKRPYFSGAPEDWVDGKKLVVQGPGLGLVPVPDTGGGANVIDWDLEPQILDATPVPYVLIPPASQLFTNDVVVTGDQYYVSGSSGVHYGVMKFADLPMTGKWYFYWQPQTGYKDQSERSSSIGAFPYDITQGSGVWDRIGVNSDGMTAGLAALNYVQDPLFDVGQVCLVEFDCDTGEMYLTTPNMPRTLATGSPFIPQANHFIGGLLLLANPTGYVVLNASISVQDLGSGFVPDPAFQPLQATYDPPIPVEAINGDILRVISAGSFQNVPYDVNEGAIVADKDNSVLIPVVRDQFVEPVCIPFLAVSVGPNETYKKLETLYQDLINEGKFGVYLFVLVVEGHTFDNNTVELSFPNFTGVSIDQQAALNAPSLDLSVWGSSPYGIGLSGEWNVERFTARNLRIGPNTTIQSTFRMNIIGLDSNGSETAVLRTTDPYVGDMVLKDVCALNTEEVDSPTKFHAYPGTGVVTLLGYFNCSVTIHNGYVTVDKGSTGNLGVAYTQEIGQTPPPYLVYVTGGSTVYPEVLNNLDDPSFEIAEAIHINRGTAYYDGAVGYFTNYCNLTQGVISPQGLLL